MKKILFPTDFSQTADNAFIYALHLAQSNGSEIYVLHTFERPAVSGLRSGSSRHMQDVLDCIEECEQDHFQDEFQKLKESANKAEFGDVKLNYIFEVGNLLSVMKSMVSKYHIDLIIMGTSGKSGISKSFLGSHTSKTIDLSPIPVISIPHLAKFSQMKTIGLATMFKESDKTLVEKILHSAEYYEGIVKILHVIEYNGNMDKKQKFADRNIKAWKEYFKSDRLEFIVEKADHVKVAVKDFANKEHIDMLVLVKRRLNFVDSLFYPSLTKNVANSLNIPLMVVKEPQN